MSFVRRALFLALLASPLAARAADRAPLEISGASFKPLPLALAPFGGPGELTGPLGETLREDLLVSGLFDVLDPRSFLADPKSEGLTAASIDFSKWSAVGADSLVKATVTGDGKAAKVEFRLFDVVNGKEVLKGSYAGKSSELRTFAHLWADKLVEHFTGEKGVFRTRLAFVAKSAGAKQIWVADWDGRNAAPVTTGGELNLLPAWSPDGTKVVFTSYRTGSPMLHVVDTGSKGLRGLPARGDLQTGAVFSPDGRRIAFTMSKDGNSDIWVMNVDGSDPKQLTDTRETESSPSWSPDGKRLAFVSTRSGDPQIFVMNADGGGVERLTFQGKYNQTPEWSPRGDAIAFTARDERNVFDLFVVDLPGKKIRRLTQDQGNNEEPSWAPNGRHLVFTSTRDGAKRLYVMNADGTNQRRLALDAEASTPAWGPWTDAQ